MLMDPRIDDRSPGSVVLEEGIAAWHEVAGRRRMWRSETSGSRPQSRPVNPRCIKGITVTQLAPRREGGAPSPRGRA
jgi:hypothetical protein